MNKSKALNIFAWVLSFAVVAIAFVAWGQGSDWQLLGWSTYQLFPLFGMIAFSLMWGHYVMTVLRQLSGLDKATLSDYFEATSLMVLVAICLHPGLLIWQLWRDGFGLPPASYAHYVAPGMEWVALLGTVSFFVFLAYELRRWFGQKSWWRFVGYGSDLAMLAILYHSLTLGGLLQSGWLQKVWYFYGVVLIVCLVYIHGKRLLGRKPA